MIIKGKNLEHFDDVVKYARAGIILLCYYHGSFDYPMFGDRGSGCWNPLRQSEVELRLENEMLGAVRTAMPHNSDIFKKLSSSVAADIGKQYVQYDWLCKTTARILSNSDEDLGDLKRIAKLQRAVKQRMEEKGINKIQSLEELI